MKGVSGKQIFTYIVIFAILGIVAAYFLGYKKNMEKVTTLQTSNNDLESRVTALKGYYDEQKTYIDAMEEMKPKVEKVLSKYGSNVKEEDQIMQAVISQQQVDIQYDNINLAKKEAMLTISQDVVKGAAMEKYQNQIAFSKKATTYKNKLDYHNLKKMIQTIYDSEYHIGIKGITYVKGEAVESKLVGIIDEETGEIIYVTDSAMDEKVGILNGSLDLEFYYVSGNGVEYKKPDMKDYISGTEDFFALVSAAEEEEEEEQ